MAKERKRGGYREPTEREAEGLRQLVAFTEQLQQMLQERNPEGLARMMEQAQQQQNTRER